MGRLKSRISQHGFVLEPCQFRAVAMRRRYQLFCAAVCTVIGISPMAYVVKRYRTLESSRVMVNVIEGWVTRQGSRPASRSRQLPPSFTRTTPVQLGGEGCLQWKNRPKRTLGRTRS